MWECFCEKYRDEKFLDSNGCGVSAATGTFNTAFNQAGGGVFAMEWVRSKFIRVWNFVQPNIPSNIISVRICSIHLWKGP